MSKYQQLLDEIPDDWEVVPISKLGKVVSGGTPTRDVSAFWGGNIPWITPGEVSKTRNKLVYKTSENITEHGLNSSGANLLPENSLLVTSRATLGARVVNATPMATNQGFKSIIFHQGKDADFYYHFFDKVVGEMERRASGTTFLEISGGEFSSILLPSPVDEEKKTIATILDTLDSQIRQTEAIIAKLQQVKQGLLHDLLTRGIDENGQLRPTYEQAPELYKDSPLGWIPSEWEVLRLATFSKNGLSNGVFKEPKRVGKGVPLVNVADLYRGDRLVLEACELFDASPDEVKRYGARAGDIFFTRSSLKLEGIAQTSYLNSETKSAVYECHVMRLRPKKNLVFPRYLKEWCVGSFARKHFMENAKQVTMTTISQDGIAGLLCPKPDLDEQEKCVAMIESYESRILKEINLVKKLKKQKVGLMDDLLTGRVRVTELIDQQQQAS